MKDFEFDEYVNLDHRFDIRHHVISADELCRFHLQRRFGSSWWLYKLVDGNKIEIGKIDGTDLLRFLKWLNMRQIKGSALVEFSSVSHSIDLLKDLSELYENFKNY